jgi:hypothetical protein
MLLIAVTAVWTSYYTGRKSIARDKVAIRAMHALAPELHIRHRNEYTCLQIDREDAIREYQCYLPLGHEYQLQFVWSKEVSLNDKALQPETSASIAAGKHQILLNELPDKLIVTVDGQNVLDVPRKRPELVSSASTGVNDRFDSQWYALDQPLTLLRLLQFKGGQVPDSSQGIALWIVKTD